MEEVICECFISGKVLRLSENKGAALPFVLFESIVGYADIATCRDTFANIDTATQAYLDRRRELRAERGL